MCSQVTGKHIKVSKTIKKTFPSHFCSFHSAKWSSPDPSFSSLGSKEEGAESHWGFAPLKSSGLERLSAPAVVHSTSAWSLSFLGPSFFFFFLSLCDHLGNLQWPCRAILSLKPMQVCWSQQMCLNVAENSSLSHQQWQSSICVLPMCQSKMSCSGLSLVQTLSPIEMCKETVSSLRWVWGSLPGQHKKLKGFSTQLFCATKETSKNAACRLKG